MTLSAESGDQDLIVLLDEVQATVLGDEGGDLLGILDQLNPHALPDGRVRLLGLDTDLLKDDALGVRGSTEGIGLPPGAQVSFFVVLIGPNLEDKIEMKTTIRSIKDLYQGEKSTALLGLNSNALSPNR